MLYHFNLVSNGGRFRIPNNGIIYITIITIAQYNALRYANNFSSVESLFMKPSIFRALQ